MQNLIFKFGMALVLIVGGFIAVCAFAFPTLFASSEVVDDRLQSSLISRKQNGRPKVVDIDGDDVPEAEYQARLERIREFANAANFEELVKEGDEIQAVWGTGGGERYAKLVLELTSDLGSSEIVHEHPEAMELRDKYATAALARSDSFSIDSELHLAMELRHSAFVRSFNETEALKLRNSSKLWLHLLARLERENDPSFNPYKALSLSNHLITPAELAAVKDPVEKSRLEALEAAHQKKLKKYVHQYQLQNVAEIAEPLATKFLANVYSRPPFRGEELKALLSEYPISVRLKKKILKARDDLAQNAPSGR